VQLPFRLTWADLKDAFKHFGVCLLPALFFSLSSCVSSAVVGAFCIIIGFLIALGEVAYANVELNPDGRSKGWGVVEFVRAEDARKATCESCAVASCVANARPLA
jgi:hypothetical protein